MHDVNDVPTCPIELRPGFTCGADVIVTAPFPICIEHTAELYQWARRSFSWEGRASGAVSPVVPPRGTPTVYYLALTGYIKIGWSANVFRRLNMYTADCHLLATEPGTMAVEKRRHSEFSHLRVVARGDGTSPLSRELFFPAPDLVEHVNGLRRGQGYAPIVMPSAS